MSFRVWVQAYGNATTTDSAPYPALPTPSGITVKVYNGSTWDTATVKVYNGATWDVATPKVYDGATWQG